VKSCNNVSSEALSFLHKYMILEGKVWATYLCLLKEQMSHVIFLLNSFNKGQKKNCTFLQVGKALQLSPLFLSSRQQSHLHLQTRKGTNQNLFFLKNHQNWTFSFIFVWNWNQDNYHLVFSTGARGSLSK